MTSALAEQHGQTFSTLQWGTLFFRLQKDSKVVFTLQRSLAAGTAGHVTSSGQGNWPQWRQKSLGKSWGGTSFGFSCVKTWIASLFWIHRCFVTHSKQTLSLWGGTEWNPSKICRLRDKGLGTNPALSSDWLSPFPASCHLPPPCWWCCKMLINTFYRRSHFQLMEKRLTLVFLRSAGAALEPEPENISVPFLAHECDIKLFSKNRNWQMRSAIISSNSRKISFYMLLLEWRLHYTTCYTDRRKWWFLAWKAYGLEMHLMFNTSWSLPCWYNRKMVTLSPDHKGFQSCKM